MDREQVIKEYEDFVGRYTPCCTSGDYALELLKAVLALLKEQEADIAALKASYNELAKEGEIVIYFMWLEIQNKDPELAKQIMDEFTEWSEKAMIKMKESLHDTKRERWEKIVDEVLANDKESETIIKARKELFMGLYDDCFSQSENCKGGESHE